MIRANLQIFCAMFLWATGFPAADVLLESWGPIVLNTVRTALGVAVLATIWLYVDGIKKVAQAPWIKGLFVGGLGFGVGSILLLIGQKVSDPVVPAVAASMMPIAGAVIEVIFDGRKMTARLYTGGLFALLGGMLASGANVSQGDFGYGAMLCLVAVVLFAWGTRATTRSLPTMSTTGKTALTMLGALSFIFFVYVLASWFELGGTRVGDTTPFHWLLMFIFAVVSMAIAQLLWIFGSSGLGILLASFHMNAVPFYVMAIVVLIQDKPWNGWQAVGAALVGCGVLIAQSGKRRKQHRKSGENLSSAFQYEQEERSHGYYRI
ncbi:MAG: DMT family transporter [Pseudomonadota bacterium]